MSSTEEEHVCDENCGGSEESYDSSYDGQMLCPECRESAEAAVAAVAAVAAAATDAADAATAVRQPATATSAIHMNDFLTRLNSAINSSPAREPDNPERDYARSLGELYIRNIRCYHIQGAQQILTILETFAKSKKKWATQMFDKLHEITCSFISKIPISEHKSDPVLQLLTMASTLQSWYIHDISP